MTPLTRRCALTVAAALALSFGSAHAAQIDNGIPSGTVGHVNANVDSGGELSEFTITGERADNGELLTEDIVFDYITYIDVGNDGSAFSLSGSTATSAGDNAVSSNGSFSGQADNTINWDVTSTLDDNSQTLTSVFNFEAESGTLGDLRLLQYLDEDIESVSDDYLFTRGSAAGDDLRVFTVDGPTGVGVAQSGAFSEAGGLSNSEFAGWVADEYSQLASGGEVNDNLDYQVDGNVDTSDLPATTLPFDLGPGFGDEDVTTSFAWDVFADATSATIVSSIGGVPDIEEVEPEPPSNPIPEPASSTLALLAIGGLALTRRRRTA